MFALIPRLNNKTTVKFAKTTTPNTGQGDILEIEI
jgi:hypothetical protein